MEKSYEHFRVPMEASYIPRTFLYIFRYLSISEENKNFSVVLLNGTELVEATDKNRTVTDLKNYYEILEKDIIPRYFPLIDMNEVHDALSVVNEELKKDKDAILKR